MESIQLPSYSGHPRLLQPIERIKHVVQTRRKAAETDEDRQKRLAVRRASYAMRCGLLRPVKRLLRRVM